MADDSNTPMTRWGIGLKLAAYSAALCAPLIGLGIYAPDRFRIDILPTSVRLAIGIIAAVLGLILYVTGAVTAMRAFTRGAAVYHRAVPRLSTSNLRRVDYPDIAGIVSSARFVDLPGDTRGPLRRHEAADSHGGRLPRRAVWRRVPRLPPTHSSRASDRVDPPSRIQSPPIGNRGNLRARLRACVRPSDATPRFGLYYGSMTFVFATRHVPQACAMKRSATHPIPPHATITLSVPGFRRTELDSAQRSVESLRRRILQIGFRAKTRSVKCESTYSEGYCWRHARWG